MAQRDDGYDSVLTIKACSEEASHFSLNYQASNISLTNFVDQSAFPLLADFNSRTDAQKWTNLEQNVVYQIVSTGTVYTQHGQSVIMSLKKADVVHGLVVCYRQSCYKSPW